jgi:hypothetical protein
MNKSRLAAVLALGVATAAFAAPALAGPIGNEIGPNLVKNGGFEDTPTISGAGSGWTASGPFTEGFDYFIDTSAGNAHGGSHSFAGGAVGGLGFISQNIATTVGTSYNIHLWLANFSGSADNTALQVLWNGAMVYSATDILGFGYQEIVIDPMATAPFTTLAIGYQDDSFYLNIDDIVVRAVTPVPEPESLVLIALGLAGIGMARRRAA